MVLNCGVGEDSVRVPWTTRRSKQSVLKEINLEYSLESLEYSLMLKLQRQYFGHLIWRAYSWEKTLMLKDWRQEKGMTEDEMVWWHHWLSGHDFEQPSGDDEGQGSLVCCSPWDHKELDTTERLNKWEDWLFLTPLQSLKQCSQAGAILPSRDCLAMCGASFGCHN